MSHANVAAYPSSPVYIAYRREVTRQQMAPPSVQGAGAEEDSAESEVTIQDVFKSLAVFLTTCFYGRQAFKILGWALNELLYRRNEGLVVPIFGLAVIMVYVGVSAIASRLALGDLVDKIVAYKRQNRRGRRELRED